MPRFPTAHCRLAAGALAAAVLVVLAWPFAGRLGLLFDRLLGTSQEVGAAVEETTPPSEEPSAPSTPPADPAGGEKSGPSIDPDGNTLGDPTAPGTGTPP